MMNIIFQSCVMLLISVVISNAEPLVTNNHITQIEVYTLEKPPSFKDEILPIFQKKCGIDDCHGKKEKPSMKNYEEIKKKIKRINKRISDINIPMPPRGQDITLETMEYLAIVNWIKAGAPNN
ncbi:MAG: hypothetical protein AAFO07_02760 [Bacteroidota bacterium]